MIIGLCGYKRAGKSTVGSYIAREYGFSEASFVRLLKEAVANLFDLSIEQVEEFKDDSEIPHVEVNLNIGGTTEYTYSWREILQRFGTEVGRNVFGQDFWVQRAMDPLIDQSSYVFTGVRFDNEAEAIKQRNGAIIQIIGPIQSISADAHASEAGLSDYLIDHRIVNYGSLETLYDNVDFVMSKLHIGKVIADEL